MDIKEILARRSDLSTFLVHLTRNSQGVPARTRLELILADWRLVARTAYGAAASKLAAAHIDDASQRCVCFTEAPLEQVYWLLQAIEDRQIQFAPYGIALTKKQARRLGVNPVWYVDITPGHAWLMNPINDLVDEAIESGHFGISPTARIAPFVEQMGTGQGYRKEFWWEREWRHRADFNLPDRLIILCPQEDFAHFREIVSEHGAPRSDCQFVDPRWGLEQIIGRLVGYVADEIEML